MMGLAMITDIYGVIICNRIAIRSVTIVMKIVRISSPINSCFSATAVTVNSSANSP